MNPYRLKAYLLFLLVALIWGIAPVIIKFTLAGVAPVPFLVYRFGISTIFALIYSAIFGLHFPKKKKNIIMLLIYGVVTSTISLGFLFLGLKETTVLQFAIISFASPLFVIVAGVIFLNEHVTFREQIGTLIAIIGTVFSVFEPVIHDGTKLGNLQGNLLILLSLIATTVSVVLAKKLLRNGVSPTTMTNTSFILGFITLLPLLFVSDSQTYFHQLKTLSFSYHLGVLYMALISGSLAYWLANKAQKSIEVGEAAVFGYLQAIFTAPLAFFWLNESLDSSFYIAAVIITVGVVIAEYKRKRVKEAA